MVGPEFYKKAFNCPHCGAYAQMHWFSAYLDQSRGRESTEIVLADCTHCRYRTVWMHPRSGGTLHLNEPALLIWPSSEVGEAAHADMPESIRADYAEARAVATASPRSAAALLRLCVDKLTRELLGEGAKDDVNANIGLLVSQGLPTQIQQALDIVRVVGNKALHPGELSSEDVAGVAERLFPLVNAIVDDRITRPRALAKLYEVIPQRALDGIAKRDGQRK